MNFSQVFKNFIHLVNLFRKEFDHSDFYGKNSTNLNNNSENPNNSGFKKCARKGLFLFF